MLVHTWINLPVSCVLQEHIKVYHLTLARLVLLARVEFQQLDQQLAVFSSLLVPFVHQVMQEQ
jgi:hypothetical protein